MSNQFLHCACFYPRPAVSLGLILVSLLPTAARAQPTAEQPSSVRESLLAIERLGGHAYRTDQGWHVDFHVHGQRVEDSDLSHVTALGDVRSLNLRATNVSDEGLRQIGQLTSLKRLHLDRTAITDAGIQSLTTLKELQYLNVCGTALTDASTSSLSALKSLKQLYVWRTKITEAGAIKLRVSLPDVVVERGVELSSLPPGLTAPTTPAKPRMTLAWKPIQRRSEAAVKSDPGQNVDLYVENKRDIAVKLFWISYDGVLQQYGEVPPGGKRKQNTYSNNAWLITDLKDQPLGWFIVKDTDGTLVIPSE